MKKKKDSKSFALFASSARNISRSWKLYGFKEDWINEFIDLHYPSPKRTLYEQLIRSYADYESRKLPKRDLRLKIKMIQGEFEKLPNLMKNPRESDEFLKCTFLALKDLIDINHIMLNFDMVRFECPYCNGVANAKWISFGKFYAYCTSCNTIRTRDRI